MIPSLFAGHAPANEAWDALVHLCCPGTLWAWAQLAAPGGFQIGSTQPVPLQDLLPSLLQDFVFVLAEFLKVPVSSSLSKSPWVTALVSFHLVPSANLMAVQPIASSRSLIKIFFCNSV